MRNERQHRRGSRLRALGAVLALYGLVLQAFLMGLSPVPAASAAGVICTAHGPGHPSRGGRDAPLPSTAHACCAAACQGLAPPPLPQAAALARPLRVAVALTWRRGDAVPVRTPPPLSGSARGPPRA
ncbi:hypothetical protein [Methylobacterium sp. ID0610]|uniref:hypothetical protein n=1 Tax=Methylobacterium carpenticola TaxID=3344827 RepID=UPI0036A89D50